ncbi:acylphosphatase [Vibrio sp. Of7-15]|uniref:acylphosphatase n=1 Tax=Vibrio sp. Of7-15 TaxID=2724879 RepID=UPI001EF2AD37|nr:acylphosphatase [Vibrio sp. Of7-15]MCG7497689.1 acylphosphatase [Vibrio sp. Of7-15]
MSQLCFKALVSGRVQGVGFRYHTTHEGLKLGLTGYAKNLDTGDVEVFACGSEDKLKILEKWLEHGPKTSRVDNLKLEWQPWQKCSGFTIK